MNDGAPSKILIVDDDKFLLNMYSIKFQKEGFDVITASEGADALKKLQDGFVPEAIVLDVIMPIMDGLEFLEKMRSEGLANNSVVLILSNQGQSSDIEKAKKLGIDGYIVKATTIPSEVVSEIKRMLDAKKAK